jgi:hypothetical protein
MVRDWSFQEYLIWGGAGVVQGMPHVGRAGVLESAEVFKGMLRMVRG